MGNLIPLPLDLLEPTQKYLKSATLEKLLTAYATHSVMLLPPPAVRFFHGSYLIIDGHHRIAISKLLDNTFLEVYQAEHSSDYLNSTLFPERMTEAVENSNLLINKRFEEIHNHRSLVSKRGILKIEDMYGYSSFRQLAASLL